MLEVQTVRLYDQPNRWQIPEEIVNGHPGLFKDGTQGTFGNVAGMVGKGGVESGGGVEPDLIKAPLVITGRAFAFQLSCVPGMALD